MRNCQSASFLKAHVRSKTALLIVFLVILKLNLVTKLLVTENTLSFLIFYIILTSKWIFKNKFSWLFGFYCVPPKLHRVNSICLAYKSANLYPQKTGKTQERCTIVFELPPLQEYTVTLYTPRTRSSVFLNIQMNAWNFSHDSFSASFFLMRSAPTLSPSLC